MPKFSQKSHDRLKTCSWDLQIIFHQVIKHYDCTILEGHRGEMKQNRYFTKGISRVDWPDGKHNFYPSKAVDVAPWPIPENWGEDNCKDIVHFYELAAIVKVIAEQMDIKIRWGGDWDGDSDYKDQKWDDLCHFELL